MTTEELIKICRERNEIEFLFQLTKCAAECDSIGEGYSYCGQEGYSKENFNNAEKFKKSEVEKQRGYEDEYCNYLEYGGAPLYELYLKHIGVI